MQLAYLMQNIPLDAIYGSLNRDITGIAEHAQHVKQGDLFVARKGFRYDGAKFAEQALQNGAAALLLEEYNSSLPITQCKARLTSSLLSLVFRQFYGTKHLPFPLVGITGTNGKTTTSYYLHHLLSRLLGPVGLINTIETLTGKRSFSSRLTTPSLLTLHQLLGEMLATCKGCVMEVSSHALHQGRVFGLVFDLAIFTNLSHDHLDYHKTMQAYGEEKRKLFTSANTSVINIDDPFGERLAKTLSKTVFTYSLEKKHADFYGTQKGGRWWFSHKSVGFCVKAPIIGRHNAYNLLGAVAAATLIVGSFKEAVAPAATVPQVRGRLERIANKNIYVDYAHTPDALSAALQALKAAEGRIITVFGCGGDRDVSKRALMGRVAEEGSDYLIITSDNPRHECPHKIIREICQGLTTTCAFMIEMDRAKAIAYALKIAQPSDRVLIAGKGHEQQQYIHSKALFFDDREVALQYLRGNDE